jgi:hypothetical protein
MDVGRMKLAQDQLCVSFLAALIFLLGNKFAS